MGIACSPNSLQTVDCGHNIIIPPVPLREDLRFDLLQLLLLLSNRQGELFAMLLSSLGVLPFVTFFFCNELQNRTDFTSHKVT